MKNNISGEVTIVIRASKAAVWEALTRPDLIKQYFFGTDTTATWEPGTPVRFEGEWQGKKYQDKGTVLANNKEQMLQYDYWSSMGGMEDKQENYMIVTYLLGGEDGNVTLTIKQENIVDEKTRDHSIENWKRVAEGLKKVVEEKSMAVI